MIWGTTMQHENRLNELQSSAVFGASRLAFQLAKEDVAGRYVAADIAADVVEVLTACEMLRCAALEGDVEGTALAKARLIRVAGRHGARVQFGTVVGQSTQTVQTVPAGTMLVGFIFSSGAYTCGFRNVFFVS